MGTDAVRLKEGRRLGREQKVLASALLASVLGVCTDRRLMRMEIRNGAQAPMLFSQGSDSSANGQGELLRNWSPLMEETMIWRRIVLVFVLVAVVGCSYRAEQLRQQPLTLARTVALDRQGTKAFVIYPFEDLRGGEYGYIFPSSFIPIINFLHLGFYNKYPEQAGILTANRGGRPVVSVGSMDAAMPYLLATMMRQMKLSTNVTPLESVNAKVDLRSFDYVIQGKVNSTKFTEQANIVPLGVLGLIGMPFVFSSLEMSYEVLVFRANDLVKPVLRQTYRFEDSTAVGLYYNQSAAFDMFIAGLETTLPNVVADIAGAVK